ncbi:MAG: rod shape-determining protein [Candidatus Staskawiczbacteria bacterium]|nr:rod shape-determining protein [Candidatus Staskawiczbacteria bacterium]
MFIKKIGIDLGTTYTLVFVPGKGIVINEPTVVAISVIDNEILAVGAEAKIMIGRTPDNIIASRPLKDGVIADYKVTERMINYFIKKALGRIHFFRPEVMISVPAGITSTEKRAVIQAALSAGAKAAYVVKEPVLAAIGAGIPINESSGHMIVNIGGGTCEIAIISLGSIVVWASVRVAGNKIDAAIADYIKKKYGLAIGEQTAEEMKITIGRAMPTKKEEIFELKGRDLISGLPKIIKISSNEINESISETLKEMVRAIKQVFHQTPPELSADIMDKGIIISGGTSMLKDLDEYFARQLGVAVYRAQDPLLCVVKGTGIVLDNLDVYKRSIANKK